MDPASHDRGEEASHLLGRLSRCLESEPLVRLAYLFGSRARGGARAESDFDIAVLLEPGAVSDPTSVKDVLWKLSAALGRVIRSDLLDLVVLNHAPPLLRHRVIRDGVLILSRSEDERVRFVLSTLRDYQDIEPRLREHTRRRVERLRQGRDHGRHGDLLEKARRAGRLLGKAAPPR